MDLTISLVLLLLGNKPKKFHFVHLLPPGGTHGLGTRLDTVHEGCKQSGKVHECHSVWYVLPLVLSYGLVWYVSDH